jgi:glycosyltransferase involved in cell wall biosynthesis
MIELLEQLDPVHRGMPELRLTIVGDGPQRALLEAWIEEHSAREWVRIRGRVDNETLRDLYRESWLIASASLAEGWGLTLTEAAGCGTPAVATDIGGHRSAVRDGVTGSLVPLDKLGERCGQLLGDRAARDVMAENAVEWARSLSWDALAAGVLQPLHDEIVNR